MEINKVDLGELDIFELETMQKYENAIDKTIKEMDKLKKPNITGSEAIRIQCHAIMDCFNEIFGEGTDKKVFGNKTNLIICLKAFDELTENINEQKVELEAFANKYSPNRATRRSKK